MTGLGHDAGARPNGRDTEAEALNLTMPASPHPADLIGGSVDPYLHADNGMIPRP